MKPMRFPSSAVIPTGPRTNLPAAGDTLYGNREAADLVHFFPNRPGDWCGGSGGIYSKHISPKAKHLLKRTSK